MRLVFNRLADHDEGRSGLLYVQNRTRVCPVIFGSTRLLVPWS